MTQRTASSSAPAGAHRSIWLETTEGTDYGGLADDLAVDTAVVGGGIVGVTTALNLIEAGQSVALLERDRIVTGVTGHTTAKLTSLHGLLYEHLLDHFGERRAHQYARANEAAIDDVEATVREYDVDCDFERTPAYTYTTDPEKRDVIRAEARAASRLGLPATFDESTSLPYDADVEAAVRFDEQAHFHPRAYLLALAEAVARNGGHVFENTTVTDVVDGEPCTVETNHAAGADGGGTVTADDVVIATHFPVVDPAFFFARMYPKRSYVLAARIEGEVPEGLYYDPGEPYFSVRPHPAGNRSLVLLGGENHRTGHGGSTADRYERLERRARSRFDVASIEYRWSTQDMVSVDRVPLVGPPAPTSDHVFVATGFGGWGMTNGVAAGQLLADLILGRDSPWREVFRPTRIEIGASVGPFLEHNRHAMGHFVSDFLAGPADGEPRTVEPGSGAVMDVDGRDIAVHRDEDGDLHAHSARCPHMGCLVEWNDGEHSWDCPCHGSRFDADGTVLDTPAIDDLESIDPASLPSIDPTPERLPTGHSDDGNRD